MRLEAPQGLPVTAQEAPHLFELIEKVRAKTGAPRPDRVLIDGELNAAVWQQSRYAPCSDALPGNVAAPGLVAAGALGAQCANFYPMPKVVYLSQSSPADVALLGPMLAATVEELGAAPQPPPLAVPPLLDSSRDPLGGELLQE